ncbi:MAG: hypothetical protein OEY86_13880 [Nitrospira sp.]|nr:hypothetical protein [Nitrospira sp.]
MLEFRAYYYLPPQPERSCGIIEPLRRRGASGKECHGHEGKQQRSSTKATPLFAVNAVVSPCHEVSVNYRLRLSVRFLVFC